MIQRLSLLLICIVLSCCEFDENDTELCFIGDSITYLWDLEYYFPNYVIKKHAVKGAKLSHIDTWNVEDCSNKKTILLIGTNDIGSLKSNNENIEYYRMEFCNRFYKTAQRIDANPLIVVSILPRNARGIQDTLVNVNIKAQNEKLREMLNEKIPNSIFLDVFDLFLYKGFKIREDLFKDGLHPNDEGYEILARKIQKKL